MARTAEMRLIELMILKQDISAVIEYIGKKETFQFQKNFKEGSNEKNLILLLILILTFIQASEMLL